MMRFSRLVLGKNKCLMTLEAKYGANNYSPLEAVLATGSGSVVRDAEGNKYLDCLAGYGAVNQGHCHPRIIEEAKKQLNRMTLSSRAFYNDKLGPYSKYITEVFGYDKMLPTNTGAEGVETAFKLARLWGYTRKHIPKDKALIVCAKGNFHGRTMVCVSLSDDPCSYENFGPNIPGTMKVAYGDAKALENVFKKHHKRICGYICEPIQGEAGVIIPPKGYLRAVRKLCTQYNILYIDDEVQSGLGRSGKLLAVNHENVRPDIVVLAKALGGGVMPIAAVLADKEHMVFSPGTHGSTFGGSPLAAAVAKVSLQTIIQQRLPMRAQIRGKQLHKGLLKLKKKYACIKEVRCRGLFSAIEMKQKYCDGKAGIMLMRQLKNKNILTKVTHQHTLRMTPPLVIDKKQIEFLLRKLDECLQVIEKNSIRA